MAFTYVVHLVLTTVTLASAQIDACKSGECEQHTTALLQTRALKEEVGKSLPGGALSVHALPEADAVRNLVAGVETKVGSLDQTLQKKNYIEIGSYRDQPDRALRHYKKTVSFVFKCSEACKNFEYFALQSHGECWCDNDYRHATKYGKAPKSCGELGKPWCNKLYRHTEITVDICKTSCTAAGFCCARTSGCQRPSCHIGCEIASRSSNVHACKASCSAAKGCYVTPAGFDTAEMCQECKAGGPYGGSCTTNCEPGGGCDHACEKMLATTPFPLSTCKASCTAAGFCCARTSGCQRPSCHIGCEIASRSSNVHACKASCQAATGCYVTPAGFGTAEMCRECKAGRPYGGSCTKNCEPVGGCEHACEMLPTIPQSALLDFNISWGGSAAA